VATGLQKSFDWSQVAASAVGAGVGYGMNAKLPTDMNPYVRAGITSFAAGTAAAVARGGTVSIQQIATDAFGQSLASAFVDSMSRPSTQEDQLMRASQESFRASEIRAQNWDARIQTALSQSGAGRWDDQALPSMADGYAQTYGGEVTQTADRLSLSRGGADDAYYGKLINTLQARDARDSEASIDSLLQQAQGLANDLNSTTDMGTGPALSDAVIENWRQENLARNQMLAAQSATDSYSGSGDRSWTDANGMLTVEISGVGQSVAATSAEMQMSDAAGAAQYGSMTPMSETDGFFTFNPIGQGIKGVGTAALNTWLAIPNSLKGIGTLAGDAYGYASQAIAPQRSVLTGQPFAYQPQSALLQSVQQQGVLGTVGAGITGAVRNAPGIGLIGALGAPNRDWGNVGAQAFNTGTAMLGAAGSMRGPSVVDFSTGESFAPGYYRADPRQLRFTQSDASPNFVDRTTGKSIGTIDSLVSDLRAGRVTADQVGSPLQVVMHDGKPFSIDNRRLVAFNAAGVADVPIEIVSLKDPAVASRFRYRFDPIRGEGLNIVITPTSGRTAAQILMRDMGLIGPSSFRVELDSKNTM
jgi:hypothetical protein